MTVVGEKITIDGVEAEVVELVPGLLAVSALAHPLYFADGRTLLPNGELAKKIKAALVETVVLPGNGFTFVSSTPKTDPDTVRILGEFQTAYPDVRIISSSISVQAYEDVFPFLVIGPITTKETSRLDNDMKRIHSDKWQA